MADFEQANRRFRVATPLGADALLLTGFRGTEGLSQLFRFELDLLAPLDAPADFAKLLGQPADVSIDLPNGEARHFHGIVSRFAQGDRDDTFVHYTAEVVPHVWLLTRVERSRIFQRKTAKEILGIVLDGIEVDWQVRDGQASREYCTQYRESDFAFACRLMEEEGIYYYFKHDDHKHTLVLSDHPDGHEPIPVQAALEYEQAGGAEGQRQQFLVTKWEKVQELRSGKVTLWDHHFELPHRPLDAEGTIQGSVRVGTVDHDLKAGNVASLERYDYPGGYAEWFDGVDPSGTPSQSADLEKIFEQNRRMVGIRLQEEAARAVTLRGASPSANLTAGHTFTLSGHYDADGEYVLATVSHAASATGDFQSGAVDYRYENAFTCLPSALPYRPPRVTPRPTVKGTQTAVVVGPAGEEIFTDPYGRVKVQFHWDREGKHDADSSCWIRVSTIWAGKGWGVIHIPRIGHEVIVDFLEGDPDRPIVLGSVYNADHIPPGALPKEGMVSGLQSRSTPGGGGSNFNGMRANDTKGKEGLTVQAEYDMTTLVKNNDTQTVNVDRKITVLGTHTEDITGDTGITVGTGNYSHTVAAGTAKITVQGAVTETFNATQTTNVTGNIDVGTKAHYHLTAATDVLITVGGSQIKMDSGGKITITGTDITIDGSSKVTVQSGGSIIQLTPDAIQATGTEVTVTGKSKASVGAPDTAITGTAKVGISGGAINSSASGMHEITGAVVKIN